MRITNITNVNKFMEIMDHCSGKVELISEQGDQYNLNSKIAQFAAMVKIAKDGTVQRLKIIYYDANDMDHLRRLISG